jgi:hypothetical protein
MPRRRRLRKPRRLPPRDVRADNSRMEERFRLGRQTTLFACYDPCPLVTKSAGTVGFVGKPLALRESGNRFAVIDRVWTVQLIGPGDFRWQPQRGINGRGEVFRGLGMLGGVASRAVG